MDELECKERHRLAYRQTRHCGTNHNGDVTLAVGLSNNSGCNAESSTGAQGHCVMENTQTDKALLAKVQSGDQDALGTLYDKHVGKLLVTALCILKSRSDAEDLLHDVFIEAWHKADSYDATKCSVYGWLTIRVRSRAIDRLRSLQVARKHAMLQQPLDRVRERESDQTPLASDSSVAKKALSLLSNAQRQAIEMGYFQGMSCQEIATLVGIPVGTVKSRLSSAIAKLRSHLAPELEAH